MFRDILFQVVKLVQHFPVAGERKHFVVVIHDHNPAATPERKRLFTWAGFPRKQFHQTLPILRFEHSRFFESCHLGQRGENVHCTGGVVGHARRLNPGRPFDDGRDAQAPFVHRPLEAAQAAGRWRIKTGQTTVVTREPNERVLSDAQLFQAGPERADAAVHGNEFAVVLLRLGAELVERLFVGIIGHPRIVRGAVPDDREEWFFSRDLGFDELERLVDDDLRGVTGVLFNFASPAHDRVTIEKICHRQPFIKTKRAGVMRILLEDRGAGPA